jgi:hypothetical protein
LQTTPKQAHGPPENLVEQLPRRRATRR